MNDLKVPPHSIEAERSVLGSILIDPQSIYRLSLRPEEFYRGDHRTIYRAMSQIVEHGDEPDIVITSEKLEQIGELEEVGGMTYLSELSEGTPSPKNIESYARVVKERARLRRYIQLGAELMQAGYSADDSKISGVLEQVFGDDSNGSKQVNLREALREAVEYIDVAYQKQRPPGIPTGIPRFDKILGGLHDQNFIVLAARPSMGKTALISNVSAHIALKEGKRVGFISLEMSRMELIHRYFGLLGNLDVQRMRSGDLSDDDWPKLTSAVTSMNDLPLHIYEGSNMTISDIIRAATTLRHRDKIDVLFLDHMHLIAGNPAAGAYQNTTQASRSLKQLAKALNIPVFAAAQLNRKLEDRNDKHPRLSDLRETGAIEEDADVIVMQYRPGYYDDQADQTLLELMVEKSRNGPLGVIPCTWWPEYMRIEERAPQRYSAMELDYD